MKRIAILIMVITVFSKILGFGREIALSYFYGASNISDAYLIALTIPSVIFGFIGVGLSTAYIPMYSRIEQEMGAAAGYQYTNNLLNIVLVVTAGVFAAGMVFTEPLVRLFAYGFECETMALTVDFTQISLAGMFFTASLAIFGAFLQIKGDYLSPALIGVPFNLCIIGFIFISSKGNVLWLAVGTTIATVLQLLLLLPAIRRNGFRYQLVFSLNDPYIRHMIYIALPVIIGTSVQQINVLVDRTLASGIAVGGISALNYANRLNGFIQGLFVTSLVTVMYPLISKMAAKRNMDDLKRTMSEVILLLNLFILPATIGAMLFTEPIIIFLFGRGAFDQLAIKMTEDALFFCSVGMVGHGLREVLSRAFYALQDTKTPMVNAGIGMVLNIILNIILARFMGISGLALATSISAIATTGLLFISLRNKIGSFGLSHIGSSFLKILFASCVMGAIAKFSFEKFRVIAHSNISLLGAVSIGTVTYAVIICFMKIKEVDLMISFIKRKFSL